MVDVAVLYSQAVPARLVSRRLLSAVSCPVWGRVESRRQPQALPGWPLRAAWYRRGALLGPSSCAREPVPTAHPDQGPRGAGGTASRAVGAQGQVLLTVLVCQAPENLGGEPASHTSLNVSGGLCAMCCQHGAGSLMGGPASGNPLLHFGLRASFIKCLVICTSLCFLGSWLLDLLAMLFCFLCRLSFLLSFNKIDSLPLIIEVHLEHMSGDASCHFIRKFCRLWGGGCVINSGGSFLWQLI